MQHMEVEGSPKGARLRAVGSREKDTYYGFLKEERDDYNERLPYVFKVRGIRGPSHAKLKNSSVYLDVNGGMVLLLLGTP